jgi:CAAX prenyl protease-like protein
MVKSVFLAARFAGLVLVVPLIEELFWRSFLMRWLIDPEFEKVPIGKVTPIAAGVTSVLFASAHPEWLPAILTGLIWAGLLWATKSVGACFASHVAANLALGLYVLSSGRWEFL